MSLLHTCRRLLAHHAIYVLMTAWGLFLLTLAGLSTEIKAYKQAIEARESLEQAARIKVTASTSPVALAEYRQIKEQIEQLHPSLTIMATGTELIIKTSRIAEFSAWRLGVQDTILANPGWRWKILRLCAGACAGSTFEIQLQAAKVSLGATVK